MARDARASVLITHPGRQHSHQAALGLERAGLLAGYWAGVPSLARHARWVPRRVWSRYSLVPLPPERVRVAAWIPALRRASDSIPSTAARWIDFWACRTFDRWAAARLARSGATAVIACEISALSTFRAARRLGLVTLLDAPSFHHATQDRVQPTLDSPSLHRRINRVKDEELRLADHVLAVSELARESYLAGGKPAVQVHAIALGADLELFHTRHESFALPAGSRDEVTFLFAGAAIQRKGFDLLIEAFRLLPGEAAARLRIVGPDGEALSVLATADRRIARLGPLDQAGLAAELRGADCLVLPSRHDSFGMVVPEALACGTPVIVSNMVGAKDLVVEDVTGWVVPLDDVAALTSRMLWCTRNPQRLRAMRQACRERAEAATWEVYHRRIAGVVGALLGAARSQRPPGLAEGSAA